MPTTTLIGLDNVIVYLQRKSIFCLKKFRTFEIILLRKYNYFKCFGNSRTEILIKL